MYVGLKIFLQHTTFQTISLYAKQIFKIRKTVGNIPKYFLQILLFSSCVVIQILSL